MMNEEIDFRKTKTVLKERWKFYLAGYVVSYVVHLGDPSNASAFSLRIICAAILFGTIAYYKYKKISWAKAFVRTIKYVAFLFGFIAVMGLVSFLTLWIFNVDLTPYLL